MRWVVGAAAVCACWGCSSDDASSSGGGNSGPPPTSIAIGNSPDGDLAPYPSNFYTTPDSSTATGLRVDINASNTNDLLATAYASTVAQVNEMNGFSTTGGVIVKLTAPIDPSGLVQLPEADPPVTDPVLDANDYLSGEAPFVLMNADENSPGYGQTVGIIPTWWEQARDDFWLVDEFTMIAQPAVPLEPGTRYVFVAKDLVARDGTPVGRSDELKAMLSGGDGYAAELRSAVDALESELGVDPSSIQMATTFTTATVHDELVAMASAKRAGPPPTLTGTWTVNDLSNGDERVRFVNTFDAPEFRRPKPNAKWEIGEDGVPIEQARVDLEFFLTFSDRTASGPRPVVIYGHGLGGDKDGVWGTSGRLAEVDPKGVAVLSIDSPEHGSRTDGETTLISSVFGFFGIAEDESFDIGRARDNFRQMASDQLELVRLIATLGQLDLLPLDANGNPAPDGVPDLDVSRILYIGHSFGSVQGPTIAALAPEITHATWNVGGAGLMTLLRDSGTFALVVDGLTPPGTPKGSVARFFAITQGLVDPGDGLNYAPYVTQRALPGIEGWQPRNVLLQEVVGDKIVPNSTSRAVARAGGLGHLNEVEDISGLGTVDAPVSGNLTMGNTGVICQFDTMEGGKTAEHGGLIFAPEAQQQYVEFFRSGLAGTATVTAPY